MAKNYGIGFCKSVLAALKNKEDKMMAETGYGFDILSQDIITERRYKRYLKEFQREKELGLTPSYDPYVHGSLTT
ncbi:hypothetical protein [Pseudoalteromonas sp. AC163]|uniref:hypothetical protein n=1 Tax=Pseudoalteromonas sp. AC163 TaxID=1055790 RepID=UPI00042843AF|nr:hypothetical protein [Pseudoalteromonas sp. AC163]